MAVLAAVGQTLVDLDDLDAAVVAPASALDSFLAAPQESFNLNVAGALDTGVETAIGAADLAKALEVASDTEPYQGVGVGKPLSITIESVYIGDYPDSMPWVPLIDKGDVLVTSAHKPFQQFGAAPRAIHLLEPDAERRTFLKATAVGQGSQLVLYSPAVLDRSILFTIEFSADREVSASLGTALATAVTAAGALPVFAPVAPFLVAAGAAIPITTKAMSLLARPHTFYRETVELGLGRPGIAKVQPGSLVLYPGDDLRPFDGFKLGNDFKLRDAQGVAYNGPLPYLVVSLDGTERNDLKGWAAQAASAELVGRFHEPAGVIGQALEIMTDSLSLYNDMKFVTSAEDAKADAKKATDPKQKASFEAQYEAYVKNIQNEKIRKTVKPN